MLNLVAEDTGGELVGWGCHGPYRDGEVRTEDAELYAIYVHPEHMGRGVGQALLTESVERCSTAGHDRLLLWVLKENGRARRFYERAGFHADGAEEPFEVDGHRRPRSAVRAHASPLTSPLPRRPHLCLGIRPSARTAASASTGWARASSSTGLARASPSVPRPSTQARATRR